MKAISRLVGLILCLVVSALVLVNALSNFVEKDNPGFSLWLLPTNTDARLNLLTQQFVADKDIDEGLAALGVEYSPADSRLWSMWGAIIEINDEEEAQKYYQTALAIDPANGQALLRKIWFLTQSNDYEAALDYVHYLTTRWTRLWPQLETLWPIWLSDPPAFEKVSNFYQNKPRDRNRIIRALAKSPLGQNLAENLIVGWKRSGVDKLWPEINALTRTFISTGQNTRAYFFFKSQTQNNGPNQSSFIYNSKFETPSTGNPFDWAIRRQTGVVIRPLSDADLPDKNRKENGEPPGGLHIRFLNNPVQFRNISQSLRLTPGNHTLTVHYSSRAFRGPKPLEIIIECLKPRRKLAQLPLTRATSKTTTISAKISVGNCQLQHLYIANQFVAKSQRNRYSGSIYLHQIELTKDL